MASSKAIRVKVDRVPAGVAAERIPDGATGNILYSAFFATPYDLHAYKVLDGFSKFVRMAKVEPARVERFLAVLRTGSDSLLYVNDSFVYGLEIGAKRDLKAGPIDISDLSNIRTAKFKGIEIPEDASVVLILSHNWHRGIYFDFSPVHGGKRRQVPETACAQLTTMLWFYAYFTLTDDDWSKVLDAGWFPFIFLAGNSWDGLYDSIINSDMKEAERQEEKIHARFISELDLRLEYWRRNPTFAGHIEFFERSVAAYKAGDWITAISVSTPRIEGVLRASSGGKGNSRKLSEDVEKAASTGLPHSFNLLFPSLLRKYFTERFFRWVDFSKADGEVSRHTVAHGVADSKSLNRKQALTLLLLIDHLNYCFPRSPAK